MKQIIIYFSPSLSRSLTLSISLQVLSDDEARRAVASAVRLQAGIQRFDTDPTSPLYVPPFVTVHLSDSVQTVSDTISEEHSVDGVHGSEDCSSSQSAEGEQVNLPSISSSPSSVATATATAMAPVKSPRLRLSYWALDTALSAVFKGPNPRLGRPSARTKVNMTVPVALRLCIQLEFTLTSLSPRFLSYATISCFLFDSDSMLLSFFSSICIYYVCIIYLYLLCVYHSCNSY